MHASTSEQTEQLRVSREATDCRIADGTTSLYLSSGGGIIGAGEHDSVRSPASALLRLTQQYASAMVERNA
ncbi:MAG: hypothetical protein ACYC3X_09105 [Pirellulaceae bacterium]